MLTHNCIETHTHHEAIPLLKRCIQQVDIFSKGVFNTFYYDIAISF